MLKTNNIFYGLFFILLLVTEFYYIHIGEGIARIYHFYSVLVVISLVSLVPYLFQSRVFLALLFFVGVNFLAVLLSASPERAFASFLSFGANVSIAIATTLILLANKVNLATLKRIILVVSLVSVLWGLLQIIAFSLLGVDLSLSPEQETQIKIGFGPGFRTEANIFAKYMVVCFLFFLPEFIEENRSKNISLIMLTFIVGILMNFTRTSIYGLLIATVFIFIWYSSKAQFDLIVQKAVKISAIVSVVIAMVLGGVLSVSEYALYKLDNLFDQTEMLEGVSSAYRLEMMELVVDDAFSDVGKLVFGNGWGQTHFYFDGVEIQAGGGDMVNILGYSGLLGVFAYLVLIALALVSSRRVALLSKNPVVGRFSRGVMFAVIGIFCTSQLAGSIIAPEFWLLIGLCIYLGIINPTNSHSNSYK